MTDRYHTHYPIHEHAHIDDDPGHSHVGLQPVEPGPPVVNLKTNLEDVAEEVLELYLAAWESPAVNRGARLGNPAEVGANRAALALVVVREVLERRRS